jgi:hypothetical protein
MTAPEVLSYDYERLGERRQLTAAGPTLTCTTRLKWLNLAPPSVRTLSRRSTGFVMKDAAGARAADLDGRRRRLPVRLTSGF